MEFLRESVDLTEQERGSRNGDTSEPPRLPWAASRSTQLPRCNPWSTSYRKGRARSPGPWSLTPRNRTGPRLRSDDMPGRCWKQSARGTALPSSLLLSEQEWPLPPASLNVTAVFWMQGGDLLRSEAFGLRGSAFETWVLSWVSEWVEEKSLSKPGVVERKNQEDLPRNQICSPRGHRSADREFTPEEIEIISQSKEDFNTSVLKTWKTESITRCLYS